MTNHCDQDCVDANPGFNGTDTRDGFGFTAPVTEFSAGQSWVGAYNMSGNVWEWVLSEPADYPYVEDDGRNDNLNSTDVLRGLRGSSWGSNDAFNFRASSRIRVNPLNSSNFHGGRCSRFNLGS